MTDSQPASSDPPADAPARHTTDSAPGVRTHRWLLPLALVILLVSLLGPIAHAGIWDPYELRVADLSRRIGVALLGATHLTVDGANNTVPTLGELARGQLPFQSIAVGFKLFGLHEWAGRLPLALWALVGAAAVYGMLARLADRATGAMALVVLATTPLYFLQARTMLGDIVTMASVAVAVAGLCVGVFDRRDAGRVGRAVWIALGLAAVACAYGARGR